jgi:hypothetical protein
VIPTFAQTTGDFDITIDPDTLEITVTIDTGSINTSNNTTGTIDTITYTGTEFEQALAWMYDNGLTIYDNEIEYRPDD